MTYLQKFSFRKTHQSQPIPGTSQAPNSAGGYAWAVDDWREPGATVIVHAW
jgi:hypothetical protein